MSYLVDTNVVSEVRKGRRCNPGVASWFAETSSEEIYLSALTVGEIRKGIENVRRRDEPTAAALEAWLGELLATHSDRILPVDAVIAERWGRFNVPDPARCQASVRCNSGQATTRLGAAWTRRRRPEPERSLRPFPRWNAPAGPRGKARGGFRRPGGLFRAPGSVLSVVGGFSRAPADSSRPRTIFRGSGRF